MKILFCNIAWMKYYLGTTEEDKPINGGSYIKENEDGGESYNFQDYNGYCYGYVMLYGNMALEKHFEGVASNQSSVDDVMVIWVATNENGETRIVGWYKNATVYREDQYEMAFTDRNHNLYYRIKASAKNCYLLPEKQRTFPIERASAVGTGMGMGRSNIWYAESKFAQDILIPKVIDYIENYNGKYANIVYTDEILNEIAIEDIGLGFDKLMEKGHENFKNDNFLEAAKYYNTARTIDETPDLLFFTGDALFNLNCFDRAKPIFEKLVELEGEKIETLDRLMYIYDFTRNIEKTLYYCGKVLPLLGDSEYDMDYRIFCYGTMFDIYVSQGEEIKAKETMNILSNLPNCGENKDIVLGNMKWILKDIFG